MFTGTATTFGAAFISNLSYIDIGMRIGASAVAMVSGVLVATVALRTLRKK